MCKNYYPDLEEVYDMPNMHDIYEEMHEMLFDTLIYEIRLITRDSTWPNVETAEYKYIIEKLCDIADWLRGGYFPRCEEEYAQQIHPMLDEYLLEAAIDNTLNKIQQRRRSI